MRYPPRPRTYSQAAAGVVQRRGDRAEVEGDHRAVPGRLLFCTVEGDVTSDGPYAWTEADHGPFEFGAAVALVKGCSPARALDVLGARRATQVAPARAMRDWAAQQDYQHYGTAVEAGEVSGWTVVIELNGYQATLPEPLEALSDDGEAVVIYQNVNGLASFQYAKNGTIVRALDPLLPELSQMGEPLPEERGIAFPGENGELHPMPRLGGCSHIAHSASMAEIAAPPRVTSSGRLVKPGACEGRGGERGHRRATTRTTL